MLNIFHYLLISIGINLLMFIPAFIFKTDHLTDLSYALTFIILAVAALLLNGITPTGLIVALMVVAWGLRLGIFLFVRIRKMKRDSRFDGVRESFAKFLKFWVLQGLSVWVVLISAIIFITQGYSSQGYAAVCWMGLLVWLLGLSTEAISDLQKYQFNQNKKNNGKFISTGLWKYSRHPNYFGEILCWTGMYIFVFRIFSPTNMIIGLASPLYIATLLLFVTGLPPLEKFADEKWGKTKEYKEYKRKTSIMVPWFPKK